MSFLQISSLALSNIGLIVSEDIPAGDRLEFLEALSKKVSNHPEAKIRIMAKVCYITKYSGITLIINMINYN